MGFVRDGVALDGVISTHAEHVLSSYVFAPAVECIYSRDIETLQRSREVVALVDTKRSILERKVQTKLLESYKRARVYIRRALSY